MDRRRFLAQTLAACLTACLATQATLLHGAPPDSLCGTVSVAGSPRGYRIVSVEGNRITHRFRTSCESRVDRQGDFRGGEQPIRREENTDFVFNCYDAPNGSTARAGIDGGVWQPMPAFKAVNKEYELVMPHHFRLLVDTRRFPAGLHHLEAEVTWPDGTLVREQADFSLFDE